MSPIPTGTVTFLFTDIEGSTRLWQEHPEAMKVALERHDALLRGAIEAQGGYVFKTVGDAFCASFASASEAIASGLEIQEALASEPWPEGCVIRVRAAIHSGEAQERDRDYFGASLSRVGRLLSAAHGGQVLVSETARELADSALPEGAQLAEMGSHRLKDLAEPIDIYQLSHASLPGKFPPLVTLDNTAHNLPRQLTSFVGREAELAELEGLMKSVPLLTLTGAGGTGKTRLALHFASDRVRQFKDGVWLLELAAIFDPSLISRSMLEVLALRESPDKSPIDSLTADLRDKEALIILDNCEHLREGCAEFAEAVLTRCRNTKIIATSREPLGIAGEHAYAVESLRAPSPEHDDAASLVAFESAQLFADRAAAARRSFEISDENASAIATICSRLDGIPLAIELAAARIRSMSATDICSRLDEKLRLLTSGPKTAKKRQQTLRGLIDWSYDLLDDPERALLQRLSVFRGGWTLRAAEQVCSDEAVDELDLLDLLSSLVDKSLVVAEPGEETRYRLLETVRDYAAEKLSEDSVTPWRNRHISHFTSFAEEAEEELLGDDQDGWLRRLESEDENFRAALAWTLSEGDAAQGIQMAGALRRFWDTSGRFAEGFMWASQTLETGKGSALERARAGLTAGQMAYRLGRYEESRTHLTDAHGQATETGDRMLGAIIALNLGHMHTDIGELNDARSRYREALAVAQATSNELFESVIIVALAITELFLGYAETAESLIRQSMDYFERTNNTGQYAMSLANLGLALHTQNKHQEAIHSLEQVVALTDGTDYTMLQGAARSTLGKVLLEAGEPERARKEICHSLQLHVEAGEITTILDDLDTAAKLMWLDQKPEEAAMLIGCAGRLRDGARTMRRPKDQEILDKVVSSLASELGDGRFEASITKGQGLTQEQALALFMPSQEHI